MPVITNPPDIDRHRREVDDGDHGGGRRPPTDKRTGGGGDPDNSNDRRRPRNGPRERLDKLRLGLFLILLVVFSGSSSAIIGHFLVFVVTSA